MHDGSHDMKVFGLGFLRSLANKEELVHMTGFLYHTYKTMEEEFDACVAAAEGKGSAMKSVWHTFGSNLRRKAALEDDLRLLQMKPEEVFLSKVRLAALRRGEAQGKASGPN